MRGGNYQATYICAMAKKAHLLLGSNMGNRQGHLAAAVQAINTTAGSVTAVSALYETEPWGISQQDAFLNIAVEVETALPAEELLATLLGIEAQLGRTRLGAKFGPRVIDIDIILIEDEVVNSPTLTLPHPAMAQRRFTLAPLAELAGNALHPILHKTISQLLAECPDELKVYTAGTLQWQSNPA